MCVQAIQEDPMKKRILMFFKLEGRAVNVCLQQVKFTPQIRSSVLAVKVKSVLAWGNAYEHACVFVSNRSGEGICIGDC